MLRKLLELWMDRDLMERKWLCNLQAKRGKGEEEARNHKMCASTVKDLATGQMSAITVHVRGVDTSPEDIEEGIGIEGEDTLQALGVQEADIGDITVQGAVIMRENTTRDQGLQSQAQEGLASHFSQIIIILLDQEAVRDTIPANAQRTEVPVMIREEATLRVDDDFHD
jgi:hypothetical protein